MPLRDHQAMDERSGPLAVARGGAPVAVVPAGGLSAAEAAERLARYGPNEAPGAQDSVVADDRGPGARPRDTPGPCRAPRRPMAPGRTAPAPGCPVTRRAPARRGCAGSGGTGSASDDFSVALT